MATWFDRRDLSIRLPEILNLFISGFLAFHGPQESLHVRFPFERWRAQELPASLDVRSPLLLVFLEDVH